MLDLDDQRKLAKMQECQNGISKDIQKTNKPKIWKDLDYLQKQQRQILLSQGELSPESQKRRMKKNKKPDKKQLKEKQVDQYEKALARHRNEFKQFHSPYSPQRLNMDILNTIKALEQAKHNDRQIPIALKKIGIKSLKTLYVGGAKRQFDIVLQFLKEGKIPKWVFQGFDRLMEKKKEEFNGTVRDFVYLRFEGEVGYKGA